MAEQVSFKAINVYNSTSQGPVSQKPRKLFLKTENCIGLKLCMKGTSVHIKNIVELNSSVIIRFKSLLWLSGYENFTGPGAVIFLPFFLMVSIFTLIFFRVKMKTLTQ